MYFVLLFFIFGLIIGSFINCLIWRLHTREKMWGRSYCPKCGKTIVWYDNIPVLSFVLLKGRCRQCGERISWQYPVVELTTGILFALAFFMNYELGIMNYGFYGFNIFSVIHHSSFIIQLVRDWFIIIVMVIIFVYDLRWYLILDKVTLPACIVVLILNLFLGVSWLSLLISAIIGSSFFLIQFIVSRGRWIGGGDIRLGLLMGLVLGRWDYLLLAIGLAYFIGSIVGIGLIIFGKKKWDAKLPLGVFLSIATVITILFGSEIINWYLNWF